MLSTEEFLITQRLSPPAIVQAAFDEARALEEIKAAVERRDEAKGEFKDAILVIGQKLIEARRAMPGVVARSGQEKYSAGFLAFIAKCGLAQSTVWQYMGLARDPKRAEAWRLKNTQKHRRAVYRRRTLVEIRDMLTQAADLDAAIEAIDLELADEAK